MTYKTESSPHKVTCGSGGCCGKNTRSALKRDDVVFQPPEFCVQQCGIYFGFAEVELQRLSKVKSLLLPYRFFEELFRCRGV